MDCLVLHPAVGDNPEKVTYSLQLLRAGVNLPTNQNQCFRCQHNCRIYHSFGATCPILLGIIKGALSSHTVHQHLLEHLLHNAATITIEEVLSNKLPIKSMFVLRTSERLRHQE